MLTASSSMLAESVHSVADTGNQLLLLLGGRRAKRAATPEHPFGYGRERYVYAFIVSIVLFSVGGLFALYEAWHKWSDPHPIDSWAWVPIVVLLAAMVMEGYALRTAIIESNRIRGNHSWARFVAFLLTADEVARAIDAAERRVRSAVPIARIIYLEPDLPQPDNTHSENTAPTRGVELPDLG